MARMATVDRIPSGSSRAVVLLSVGVGIFVFFYLTVTAIPDLGIGDALSQSVSRTIIRGLLFVVLGASLVAAYSGERLTVSVLPSLAMALGMSSFLIVNEVFVLEAVEADLPIEYGILFYFVAALAIGSIAHLVGKGTAWLLTNS